MRYLYRRCYHRITANDPTGKGRYMGLGLAGSLRCTRTRTRMSTYVDDAN